jgi:hypothetical protein
MKTLTHLLVDDSFGGGAQYFWNGHGKAELSMLRVTLGDLLPEEDAFFREPSLKQALTAAMDEIKIAWGGSFKVANRPGGLCLQLAQFLGDNKRRRDEEVLRVTLEGDKVVVTEQGQDITGLLLAAYAAGLPRIDQARAEVEAAFTRNTTMLTAGMLGDRFAEKLRAMGGVLLRESGGIWYAPPGADEKVRVLAEALESTGHITIYRGPMMRAKDAAKMVLAGLTADVEKSAKEIAEWVVERESNPEAQRVEYGVDCKVRDIGLVSAKVRMYRDALALDVTGLVDQLERLQGRVSGLLKLTAATEEGRVAKTGERGMLDLEEAPASEEAVDEYRAPALDL